MANTTGSREGAKRTSKISIICVERDRYILPGSGREWFINVEINNIANRTMGPYDRRIDVPEALQLLAMDIRLNGEEFYMYEYK